MTAIAFFVLVGVLIGGGVAYGVGHVDGMREGYEQGRADELDRQLDAAQRTWAVSACPAPPYDWQRIEAADRAPVGEQRG